MAVWQIIDPRSARRLSAPPGEVPQILVAEQLDQSMIRVAEALQRRTHE
jgi:hypothetical protein